MTINKNRTYSSDGGYAASNKQKEYVPKSVAKKASLMLREQERQRLIEAAKRFDAQTRGAAAPENSGFSMVNSRQTFPEVIAANRNAGAGNVQSGSAAPRNVRDILDQPESAWRSGSFNGVIDPRAKNEFLNNIGAGSSAPKPAPKPAEKPGVLQRYSDKSNVYKGHGGAASLFDEKPNNLKSSTASDFNKTRGNGVAAVAGGSENIQKWLDEIEDIRKSGPVLTPRERQLYSSSGIADVAGKRELYDWTKDVQTVADDAQNFIDKNRTALTPKERDKIKKGQKILNNSSYEESGDYSFIPKWRDQKKRDEGFMETYREAERILNMEEFDTNFEANVAASFNRFSAMPAKTLATIMDMVADCIDSLSGEQKSKLCDWLRSMEDNSELLAKSERQYSQIDYDNEFINGLAVGVGKGLADMSSSKFIGGIMHISPDLLSDIYSAGERYNTAREKGYSVEQAMAESGLMFVVNRGVGHAYDSLKDTTSNKGMKSVLEILKNTTTTTAENAWLENNGEEGELSLEGIANTLAVETIVEIIVTGSKYFIR